MIVVLPNESRTVHLCRDDRPRRRCSLQLFLCRDQFGQRPTGVVMAPGLDATVLAW
ncbi:MAG: hypothetical protein AVDCRST_MAG70-1446 [uncultured Thermomicrobiales bacterium]|uniref:Uncharacterized protein n=1 Tax=uncultured Thermomicrobiales bacterium TaxID=1645740 RepID=A0A6J4UWF3_9BACT|nr:MAG: hypothetical protein AVDCRST_MAG70-1446 [uncultured Thermomicrobiales bacterium]